VSSTNETVRLCIAGGIRFFDSRSLAGGLKVVKTGLKVVKTGLKVVETGLDLVPENCKTFSGFGEFEGEMGSCRFGFWRRESEGVAAGTLPLSAGLRLFDRVFLSSWNVASDRDVGVFEVAGDVGAIEVPGGDGVFEVAGEVER
jgi:hypothetical protein